MEKVCGKTIDCPRSLNEYWLEAKKIMNRLKFGYLTKDDNNISDCVEAIILAEINYEPGKGAKLSSYKFRYVSNKCKEIYKQLHGKKRSKIRKFLHLHNNIKTQTSIIVDMAAKLDCETMSKFVKESNLSESTKQCFYDYYMLGMTQQAIVDENNISKQRVAQKLSKALTLLRERFNE